MKKILSLFMTLIVIFSLSACTFERPEDKTAQFIDALKTSDTEILKGYVDNTYVNMLVNSTGDEKTIKEIRTKLFKNLNYEVVSVDKNGKDATVKLKITNTAFKNAFKDYESESYSYMIDNLYSGTLNKKKLNNKCLKIFLSAVKEAIKENKKYSAEVSVKLTENDHNAYDLKVTDEFMNALTGGLISGIKK